MSRFLQRGLLDRRTVLRGMLRGAAISVALPPLEAMLGTSGVALADGTELPTRFGLWFWGGVRPEKWTPSGTAPAGPPARPSRRWRTCRTT